MFNVLDRERRQPMQRPTYLTLEAPSALPVALAIRHIIQSKEA
jgi:hypothetical protein